MNEPKININVMPGAQMNGYVKEQHNYFGNVQKLNGSEVKDNPVVDAEVVTTDKPIQQEAQEVGLVNAEIRHGAHRRADAGRVDKKMVFGGVLGKELLGTLQGQFAHEYHIL